MIVLWVAVGAALGAPLRYLTDRALTARTPVLLPVGTLTVNLVASFVLGLVTGAGGASATVVAVVGTGFCGALSTWSTFAFEVSSLAHRRERAVAAAYLLMSVVAGAALAALGWAIAA